jgi:hypothetical protein
LTRVKGSSSRETRAAGRNSGAPQCGRRFSLDFFLAHPDKVIERVEVISKKTGEVHEGLIPADQLLTWAEFQTRETAEMAEFR